MKKFLRTASSLPHLPDLRRRLAELERLVAEKSSQG